MLFCIASYVLASFPDECDYSPNQDNIELNRDIREFNQKAISLYHKTGNRLFLEKRAELWDEHTCTWNHFAPYHLSAKAMMVGLFFYYCYRSYCWFLRDCPREITEQHLWSIIKKIGPIFFVCEIVIGWKNLPYVLSYISSLLPEGSSVGICCMALLYGLVCSGYNAHQMNQLQEGRVRWEDIPVLLERDDIEII